MSPGPNFRGADRERCVSYFTLLWWSKKALSAMAGRRKRPVRCSRTLRRSSAAVATSREGHRKPRPVAKSGEAGIAPATGPGTCGFSLPRRPAPNRFGGCGPHEFPVVYFPPPAEAAMLIELSDDLELEDLMELIAEFMQRS
jgi:hypothetical protein